MNIPSRVNPFSYDNSLPPGYFRADFLESTSGRLYIVTDYYRSTSTGLEISADCELLVAGGTVTAFACSLVPADNGSPWGFGLYTNGYANFSPFSNKNLYYGSTQVLNKRRLFKLKANSLWVDGVEDTRSMYGAWSSSQAWYTARPLTLFCANQSDEGWELTGPAMKAYRFTVSVSGKVERDFIPVIDLSGTPCMFDLVTKKTFYKENNSVYDFAVGLNMEQALNLAKLPVTKNGKLTVSLPLEAAFDVNVQQALEAAAAKGWYIPVQYRESEVATANLAADFLESDGVASMELPFESENKSFACEHTMGMPKATSGKYVYGGTAVSDGYGIRYNANLQGLSFTGSDRIGNGTFLRGKKYEILWKVTRNEAGKFIFSLGHDGKMLKEITQAYNQYWRNIYYVFGSTYYNTKVGGATYELTTSIEGELTCHVVPAIDLTGTPCLYDTVSRQNFYNVDTTGSDFIVGFDTIKKAAVSLSKLPVTTGGTLTVSMPMEVALDDNVQRALDIAKARGWTIFVQYRESELTAKYIEADFLESTGTQYINTGVMLTNASVVTSRFRVLNNHSYGFIFGSRYAVNVRAFCLYLDATKTWLNYGSQSDSTSCPLLSKNVDYDFHAQANVWTFNDEVYTLNPASAFNAGACYIFNMNANGTVDTRFFIGRVYSFAISNDSEEHKFVPALDTTGRPCMHDTVSSQNFRNANTASGTTPFIVGFDTIKKAAVSLSKLPVTTGGTLTVSLPAEAEEDEWVDGAIDIATKRGWTIFPQYR